MDLLGCRSFLLLVTTGSCQLNGSLHTCICAARVDWLKFENLAGFSRKPDFASQDVNNSLYWFLCQQHPVFMPYVESLCE